MWLDHEVHTGLSQGVNVSHRACSVLPVKLAFNLKPFSPPNFKQEADPVPTDVIILIN